MHSVERGGPEGKPNAQGPGAPAPGPCRYPALVVTVLITLATVVAAPRIASSSCDEREAEQRARPRTQSSGVPLPTALTSILVVAAITILRTRRRTAKLIEDMERSRLALARASEQKVALLRGLTHDLGNTLVAAAGYTTLLRDEITGPLAPEQREQLQRIRRLIAQAISIVGDSLEIARAEAGTLPVRHQQVDVRTLLLEIASDYRAAAISAGLALTPEISEDLPVVETDPTHVGKILGDLLSNAIKYTPAGGQVWLRASARSAPHRRAAGPWIGIEVCDTGPSVPATLRERIFDEFFRTPAARATAPGTGVGLAMSRRLARMLGGDITVDGGEEHGALFTLWLPAQVRGATAAAVCPQRVTQG
jgi:signal transduction histidine kinase